MTIHDDARAASEAVYDRELERYRNLLSIADTELAQLRTDKATYVAEVERLSQEIEALKIRIDELEGDLVPEGWVTIYDSTFKTNDGWTLKQETQSNDNSYNTPKNVVFGDGMKILGKRETLGNRPYTSGDALGQHIRIPNYHRIDVTATLPVEPGMWPCPAWLRPLTHGDSGEKDVVETWPAFWDGKPVAWATIWRDYKTKEKQNASLPYSALPNPDPSAPHTYTEITTAGRVEILIDGVRLFCWQKGAKYSASERIAPLPAWYESVYEIPGREWYPRVTLQVGGPNAKEPLSDWKQSEMVIHRMRIFKEA